MINKNYFIFTLLAAITCSCGNNDSSALTDSKEIIKSDSLSSTKTIIARPSIKISPELLEKTAWEWHTKNIDQWPGFTVKLNANNTIQLVNQSYGFGEGGMNFQGQYKIENDSTISGSYTLYSDYEKLENSNFKPQKIKFLAHVKYLTDSPYRYVYLAFDDNKTKLVSNQHHITSGIDMQFDNQNIKILNCTGTTSSNVKIRQNANYNAKSLEYMPDDSPGNSIGYCPKGIKLSIIAKTVNTDVVQGDTSNWYYVELPLKSSPRFGWVFGKNVELNK